MDTLIGQIYTNRALVYHMVGNQDKVMEDTTYVLENLDEKNPKARLRRSFAHRTKQNWALAVCDLQVLNKLSDDEQVKRDLNVCMTNFMKQRNVPKKPTPQPTMQKSALTKISEVKYEPKSFKKVQIHEETIL